MRKVDPKKYEEKRTKILNAAMDCFCRRGFRGASISDICAAAGISPGVLYYYFDSKEAIIQAMTEVELKRSEQDIKNFSADLQDADFIKGHLAGLTNYVKNHTLRETALEIEMMAEGARNPKVGKIVKDFDKTRQGMLEAVLLHGQKVGQVNKAHKPEFLASLLCSVIEGLSIRSLKNPNFKTEDRILVLKLIIEKMIAIP
jgi:AcrR family transcriptional regulator